MRTVLSQFCEEFESVVRPLLGPLKQTSDALAGSSEGVPARQILPSLREMRHQLQTVADKVGEQQAYVLIFGPLKSGKSTLMNAMASAYVSEVTSLPAYPCMVYVSHAEEREFVITRYDGETETFSSLTTMRLALSRAHNELAERIRRVEAQGESFDAQIHYPSAIRRIDVRVPAGDLAESGAVLVDTPGLYTRMKFGYDRMTREFRDTAACAIFVVKSENLFLEQVFEEFNELLELFSRIFLVVNLDTNKKDLTPDGGLTPALECKDPLRIIEAFQNLAMSAPLKAAADEGRLRIYPVDLLRAASTRLRGEDAEPVVREDDTYEGQADFDVYLRDLTEYLNSTDYLVAFLGDSIRHATGVLRDIRALGRHPGVRQLSSQVDRLQSERERAQGKSDVLARLRGTDWNAAVQEMRDELASAVREEARPIKERTASVVNGTLEGWFQSDASLNGLLVDELGPVLESCQSELLQTIQNALNGRVSEGSAGIRLAGGVTADLESANVHLDSIGRSSLIQVDMRPSNDVGTPDVDVERIPVRKGFLDWILFRSQSSVRRNLFGAERRPINRIAPALKARRLGDPARQALRMALMENLDVRFPELVDELTERVFGSYIDQLHETLRNELNSKTYECDRVLADLDRQVAEIGEIREQLESLERSVDAALGGMVRLSETYGETAPEALIEPVEDEVALLEDSNEVTLEPFGAADVSADEAAPEVEAVEVEDDPAALPAQGDEERDPS